MKKKKRGLKITLKNNIKKKATETRETTKISFIVIQKI